MVAIHAYVCSRVCVGGTDYLIPPPIHVNVNEQMYQNLRKPIAFAGELFEWVHPKTVRGP